MNVVLYTTHCQKCRILEAKLKAKNIKYDIVDDIQLMLEKQLSEIPTLEVDNVLYPFSTGEAVAWVNKYAN